MFNVSGLNSKLEQSRTFCHLSATVYPVHSQIPFIPGVGVMNFQKSLLHMFICSPTLWK